MPDLLPTIDLHITLILISGLAMLGMAYLPRLLDARPLSLPIIYVAVGALLFLLPLGLPLPQPASVERDAFILEITTEILVIISLAGVGLALDRPLGWRSWQPTWRLLGITMPLGILVLAWMGHGLLGLPLAAAVLLGGVLAPTDPVLAADVQVGGPEEEDGNAVRFALTSEAGLNDSLAFPFIYLAIALTSAAFTPRLAITWLGYDLLYRVVVGAISGYLIGKALGWLAFRGSDEAENEGRNNAGLVVISGTLVAYGLTEVFHGYGFLATFVAALVARRQEVEHSYHQKTHTFIDQSERLLLSVMLIAFGGILLSGVLDAVTWRVIAVALLFVLVVRPLSGLIAFAGYALPWQEKIAISFFGIRGMGSLYYMAYAANNADFDQIDVVWATLSITILISVVIHGISATPVMRWLELNNRHKGQPEEVALSGD